jgi:hypothetical protein
MQPDELEGRHCRKEKNAMTKSPKSRCCKVLTIKICIKFRLDSQAYKSTVVAKGPFFH